MKCPLDDMSFRRNVMDPIYVPNKLLVCNKTGLRDTLPVVKCQLSDTCNYPFSNIYIEIKHCFFSNRMSQNLHHF